MPAFAVNQPMTEGGNQRIGRYELVRSLGRGAQGAVYLARDPVLDRFVAIKVLTEVATPLNNVTSDGTPLEARISGHLKHPNIVPIFDAGDCDAGPYLVFEFVEGQTLAQFLQANGAQSIESAVPLIGSILRALATAHSAEILHLDLSPRNVLIDANNVPRVMDFGLAQYIDFTPEPGGTTTGTLRYMAPEHFLGKPLGPWTDVFALGSTFFEVVTGQRAMQGATIQEIQHRIISAEVDLTPLHAQQHGEAFARFLAGALEKTPAGRYADCSVMHDAFEMFLHDAGIEPGSAARDSTHSTIDFLLRRMQRKSDFPTISRTLSDINRLTGDDASASADKLANVILRDFALTSKLLKLVNSAFYGTRSVEITSISQAIVFLGVEQVRMTANSLSFFGHLKSNSAVLKDSMTKSFLCGLITRHLAQREQLPRAEEAFICGMCQNLGENLVIYYFADEFADISKLQQDKNIDRAAASRGVLGVSYSELGAAVAKTWNLPRSIVDSIRGLPPGRIAAPTNDAEKLRDLAVFANELCDHFMHHDTADLMPAIDALRRSFERSIGLDREQCLRLVSAAFEKLRQFAPIFEIRIESSRYCQSIQRWLDEHLPLAKSQSSAVLGKAGARRLRR
jgi:serine/threonine protein kinase